MGTKRIKDATLTFSGDLTIEYAIEFHQTLLNSINQKDKISIVLENVTAIDLSFVQLICAAHRTMVPNGKVLQLVGQHPEVLKTTVRKLGFVRQMGCGLNTRDGCFWKEGWE